MAEIDTGTLRQLTSQAATRPQLCDVHWVDRTARTSTGERVTHLCELDPNDGHTDHRCSCGRRSSSDAA